jgi:hypothetical protein
MEGTAFNGQVYLAGRIFSSLVAFDPDNIDYRIVNIEIGEFNHA